jgi:hypothetical protein
VEANNAWIVIICGKAEEKDVRVALDFQDAESLFQSSRFVVGESFIAQLLDQIQLHETWVIKTVIEEVRTPQEQRLPINSPLFVLLTKSYPRGLSAGVLFLAEDVTLQLDEIEESVIEETDSILNLAQRFLVVGVSPVGFAAACIEDTRLFTRFISRLLKRPEAFTEVSLLLPRQFQLNSK